MKEKKMNQEKIMQMHAKSGKFGYQEAIESWIEEQDITDNIELVEQACRASTDDEKKEVLKKIMEQ
jgi:hypothetical protein